MLGVLLWVQHLFRALPLPFQALLCIQTPLHAVSEGGCLTDSLWPLPLRWRREEMMRSAGLRWAMSSSVQRGSGTDSVASLCWPWQSSLQDPSLAATAATGNPSPSSCPQTREDLPETGIC